MQYTEQIGYKSEARIKARLESIEYYPFHIHENSLEIICVLNGTVEICDSAATYTLSYGDVHMFNSGIPHRITSSDPESIILTVQIDLNHYKYHFKGLEDISFICDTYSDRDLYCMDIKYLRFMLARTYQLYTENGSAIRLEQHARELLELLLSQFVQYVYREDEKKKVHIVRLQNTGHIYKNYERMYRVVDYVRRHYSEKLSLTGLAEMEFLSPAHLSRYIKDTLGLSFSQLISLTRCENAAHLLSAANKTVDQIAAETGFANRNHMAVQFKKWYDKTPSGYRDAIREDLKPTATIKHRTFDYDFAKVLLDMHLDEY